MTAATRFRTTLLALWGALPLLLLVPGYKLWLVLESQVGTPRAIATFIVLSAMTATAGAIAAALWTALPTARLAERRLWPMAAFALTLASVLLLGLTVFYLHPRLAPTPVLAGSAVATLALFAAFWLKPADEQRFTAGLLLGAGRLALLAPWLGLPWVATDLATERPLPAVEVPSGQAAPTAPKRIVLLTFDALRARSTSLHTPALANTPHLEALAKEGTWFTNCHAIGDRTLVSMPALLSGRDPTTLFARIDNRLGYLREGRATGLAGYLKAAGYKAYFTSMVLDPKSFGMGHEFESGTTHARFLHPNDFNVRAYVPLGEVFDWGRRQVLSGGRDFVPEADHPRAARRNFDQARETLRAHPDKTFLWVHVGVPHDPYYDIPASDLGKEPRTEAYRQITPAMMNDKEHFSPEFERIYERYVAFGDAELGRFMRGLQADGLWDDTMVIVSADHGEQFAAGVRPHGGGDAPEDVAHVPLIIRTPGHAGPRRVDAHVSHLDVVPTVLAQVYGRPVSGLPGLPLLHTAVPADRTTFTWASFGRVSHVKVHQQQPQTIAAYQGRYKYVVERVRGGEALYDLTADPRETRDLKTRHPEVWQRLKASTTAAYP